MARNPDEGHKLFVGRLPGDCTEDELRIVFSTYGEVNSIILLKPHDRTGNRSAFVFYKDRNAGEDAIKLLNDQYKIRQDAELTLAVRWAQRRGGDAAPMDDSEAAHSSDGFKLFVGGLPPDIREDELQMVFSTYGEVSLVHCMPPSNQSGMSAAFVFYKQKEAAEDAIRLLDNQYKIREDAEQPISVRWGRDKSKGKGGGKGDYSYDSGSNNHSSNKAHDDWNQGGSSWDSSSYGAGATGGAGSQSSGDPKVFVGGLPADITQEEVETVFSTYGKVQKIHLFEPHQVNNLVAGFVFYETQEAAEDAIKLLDGVYKIREEAPAPITVKWARKDTRGGGGGGGGGGSSGGGRGSQWDQSDGGGWKSSSWQSSGSGGGGGGSWGDNSWKDSYSGGGQQNGRGGDYYNRGESQSYSGSANYGSGGGGQGGGYGNYGGGHSSGGGGGGGGAAAKEYGGGGGGDRPKNKVFVGNLPSDITEDALQYVFGNYGKVIDVHVMAGKSKSGQSCAFVNYNDPLEAETAIMTLHEKYEIRPGQGPIIVKTANPQNRSKPY